VYRARPESSSVTDVMVAMVVATGDASLLAWAPRLNRGTRQTLNPQGSESALAGTMSAAPELMSLVACCR
jgi:hypothetical protein